MKELKLYHGTDSYFETVDLLHCKERKDFGYGFYLTTDYNQAKEWAIIVANDNNNSPYTNMYRVNTEELTGLRVHRFNTASKAWLKYIITNRYVIKGKDEPDYDVVIGKVADARANIIIADYIRKYGINMCLSDNAIQDALIRALKPERLHDQYCFKTDKSIRLLNKTYDNKKPMVTIKRIVK